MLFFLKHHFLYCLAFVSPFWCPIFQSNNKNDLSRYLTKVSKSRTSRWYRVLYLMYLFVQKQTQEVVGVF